MSSSSGTSSLTATTRRTAAYSGRAISFSTTPRPSPRTRTTSMAPQASRLAVIPGATPRASGSDAGGVSGARPGFRCASSTILLPRFMV